MPTQSGQSSVSVSVTDSLGCKATQTFALQVLPVVTITTTSIPPAIVGQPYFFCFQAIGGSGAYTWQVSFASRTPGFNNVPDSNFDMTGCFKTLPEQGGSFPLSVIATDSNEQASPPASFTLQVAATTPAKASDAKLANIYLWQCFDEGPSADNAGDAAGAAQACALGVWYTNKAADPPDPNFTTIAQPVPFPFVFPNTGWPTNVSRSFDALLTNQAQLIGFAQASLVATERAQGAQAAANIYWYTRQSEAAAQFSELMTWQYEVVPAATRNEVRNGVYERGVARHRVYALRHQRIQRRSSEPTSIPCKRANC